MLTAVVQEVCIWMFSSLSEGALVLMQMLDNDWWIVGLILLGLFGTIALVSAGGLILYQKKGDAIRQALSAKASRHS